MAYDMLAIPPMSDECERIFSSTKHLISDSRNRLHMDVIDASECLKSWLGEASDGVESLSKEAEEETHKGKNFSYAEIRQNRDAALEAQADEDAERVTENVKAIWVDDNEAGRDELHDEWAVSSEDDDVDGLHYDSDDEVVVMDD